MVRARVVVGGCAVVAALVVSAGLAAQAATAPMPPPTPLASVPGSVGVPAPARLLDTRLGTGAPQGPVAPGAWVGFPVLGRGGVPATNVSSVWLTVTAITPSNGGTVRVRPGGDTTSGNTVLSTTTGLTAANLVLAQVGGNGQVELLNNSAGPVQLVADLAGYDPGGTVAAPGAVQAMTPARLLDTRTGTGAPHGAVAAHGTVALHVGGVGGVPANATAVLLNLSAVTPNTGGSLTAWPAGTAKPSVSQVSFAGGPGLGNLVMVRLGTGGIVDIANNSAGRVQLVGDVFGYVLGGNPADAGVVSALAPARLLDTRTGNGAAKAAVGGGHSVTVQMAGRGGLPATNIAAVVLTVTAVSPAAGGTISAWGDGQAKPGVANVNHAAHQNVANLVVVPVGADGKVTFANNSAASTHMVADLAGFVRGDAHTQVSSTSRNVRNLTKTDADATTLHDEGCADAQANGAGGEHVQLLHTGSQVLTDSVQLNNTTIIVTNAQLVTALNGYVDGYAACRTGTDPTYIAISTNNDGTRLDGAAGADWANSVIEPIAAHAAGDVGLIVAGANDIEPDFDMDDSGRVAEGKAAAWTRGYLGATSGPYIFTGAANGCSSTKVGGTCDRGWTQSDLYALAHGLSPTRILALPQIYYTPNAAQWRFISASGAVGADRISFLGTLSEHTACDQAVGTSNPCPKGYLTGAASAAALRSALGASPAVNVQRLPVQTDLRTDVLPGAPASATRVTTAGVH
jgi:hypothetical protein